MKISVRNALMCAQHVPMAFLVIVVPRDLLAHNASMTVEHLMELVISSATLDGLVKDVT